MIDFVKCPHCDYVLAVTSDPQVNFMDVCYHMINHHTDIALAAIFRVSET